MSKDNIDKKPCGEPCIDLQNARKKVKELDEKLKFMQKSLQQMHDAIGMATQEYGRLHLEELTLKEIFKICDETEASPFEAIKEVRNKCEEVRDALKVFLNKSKK